MRHFIVVYRDEFSTVVEAKNQEEALKKVREKPYGYQWEIIGDTYDDFFKIDDSGFIDDNEGD